MSSDKRQFDDFTKFGGKINKDGLYVYPTLYNIDTHNNKRFWRVYVRLIKAKKGPAYKFGWDINQDEIVPIIPEYLNKTMDIPDDVISQIWTESGVVNSEKMSRSAPTYPIPANVGKANERNYLMQGLVKARAAYLKQHEKGGRTQKEINEGIKKLKTNTSANDVSNDDSDIKSVTQNQNEDAERPSKDKSIRYFPMLARNFEDEKDELEYPVYVQPKLDGMRCIAFLDSNPSDGDISENNVILYSRNMKDITGFDNLRKELLNPLKKAYNIDKNESLYLDGEFYRHGSRLQDIVAEVRNIQKNNVETPTGLKLNIFDCFYPSSIDMPYEDRLDVLDEFFDNQPNGGWKWIEKVVTWVSDNESECKSLYKEAIKDKYEGIMIKNTKSPYLTSSTKSGTNLRSYGVLKLKGHFDEEYKIVGFTEGSKGKDKGALIWILETPEKMQFNATPKNMTYKERYELFNALSNGNLFKQKYLNKMLTVEFQDKSKDGVPLRAKAMLPVRDYE
jgi:DNA ligase-1